MSDFVSVVVSGDVVVAARLSPFVAVFPGLAEQALSRVRFGESSSLWHLPLNLINFTMSPIFACEKPALEKATNLMEATFLRNDFGYAPSYIKVCKLKVPKLTHTLRLSHATVHVPQLTHIGQARSTGRGGSQRVLAGLYYVVPSYRESMQKAIDLKLTFD